MCHYSSYSQPLNVSLMVALSLQRTAQLQYISENVVEDKVSAVWMRCANEVEIERCVSIVYTASC